MPPVFDSFWIVPLIGVVATTAALVFGWHLMTAKSSELTTEDALNSEFLKGVTKDRRASPRRKGNSVQVELTTEDGPVLHGQVMDRSQGGLRLLVEQPILEGTVLKVRPRTSELPPPWTAVTVRTCTREGTHYELGCQFNGMPNWNLLLQFG